MNTFRFPIAAYLTMMWLLIACNPLMSQAAQDIDTHNELILLNWSDYIDPQLIQKFEEQYSAKIREIYFDSDDERLDMLVEHNGMGFDVAIVDGISIDAYQKRNWLAPLDNQKIPNLKHIDSKWIDAFPDANGYGVPYFWGTSGIAYRKDLVHEDINSWMQLFEPAEYLHQKIGMVDSSRDLIGMALKALGYSANSETPDELKAAEQLLLKQKPHVKTYRYPDLDESSVLISGEVYMAFIYSGDVLMLSELHPEIAYVLPKEGGNIWIDYLTVMQASKNKELAYRFIDFLNEPEHARQLAEYVYYATPNRAAEQLLPAEFLEDPIIYPKDSMLSNSEFYKPLAPRSIKTRNTIYSRVIQ